MKSATEKAAGEVQTGITKARKDVATLAGALEELEHVRAGKGAANGHGRAAARRSGAVGRSEGWTGAWRNVERAGARGQRILKGLARGIERYPLLGGLAALGIGFGIATLLFRRSPRDAGE